MKRFLLHRKGVFALLLALFLGMGTAYAYDFSATCSTGQTLYYNITNTTEYYVEITYPGTINDWWGDYPKPTGDITLPSTVTHDGVTYTVTSISWYAFFECTDLTGSLTIPNTVDFIGYGAFMWCDGFSGTLTLSNALNVIQGRAFIGCTGLTGALTIPASVHYIGSDAFRGCDGFMGSLTIPDSVTEIGNNAFMDCTGFTGALTIGTSVASIGQSAFKNCNNFTRVKYNAVNCADVSADDMPFENCRGTLTIGNTVQRIPSYMFHNADGLVGSLTIPNSVTVVGSGAFEACDGFTGSLTIGNSVTTIESGAFGWCLYFSGTLTIGSSVTTIEDFAFYNDSGFTGSLTIPNSVTTIGEYAFSSCGFTGSLTLGNSLTSIGANAFHNCHRFTGSLTIPNSVTSIGEWAFYGCSDFDGTLTIPNSVTTIEAMTFCSCRGLTGSLTIPNSVTSIGFQAFSSCGGFTDLNIGTSLTTIEDSAFNYCTGLTSMMLYPETPPTMDTAFINVPRNILLRVPCGKASAYQNASGWNAFTNIQEYCDPLTYSINPDGVSVTVTGHVDGTDATGELFIPVIKVIDGVAYTVTAIGNDAFSNCYGLTGSLIIPNTVTSIGDFAFSSCTGLTGSLILSNTLTYLGAYAFQDCPGLTGDLTLPNTLTTLGNGAFYLCNGFNGNLTLPNSITAIGKDTFASCKFIGSLTIPNTVTSIGEYAFHLCSGFTGSLTIPNSVTSIGYLAFYGCSGFEGTLTIGTSVASMGRSAFKNSGFTHINYNAANCAGYNQYEDVQPFQGMNATLTIGNTVQTIPQLMFSECPDLHGTLSIPSSVTSIDYGAFYECTGFTGSLNIPNSVTSIGGNAFYHCTGFTGTLTLSNSLATIEDYTFRNCENFTGTLTIPASVTAIGKEAFQGCKHFTGDLTIPNSVTTIGSQAFFHCDGLTGNLTIGHSVSSIGYNAFRDCAGLTHLNFNAINCEDFEHEYYDFPPFQNFTGTLSFGDQVQRIPGYMFYNCTGFTGSLVIPSSVTSIGNSAFHRCTGFNSLYLGYSLTYIGVYAFYNCSGLTNALDIPESVTTLDIYAFANCYQLQSVDIGPNVSIINFGAFYRCESLSSITARPVTPPASGSPNLGTEIFQNVPTTIPVYVSCGSLSAYQSASSWSGFTNMQCLPWTVTLSTNPWDGGTVSGEGTYANGASCTVTATPNDNYLFMHWRKNGEVVSSNASYSFSVYEDTELEAVFMPQDNAGDIVGSGETTSIYLPSHSYYNYALTQQIYTASELNGSFTINSISFFNAGDTETRRYDVYLVHTSKSAFSSGSDWIPVYQADCVYSGLVTMRQGMWNTIVLDTPFNYNGTSNLALIMDDNSGTWTPTPHMACRVYHVQEYQAICIYGDDVNYAANSPSSYTGQRSRDKNQIMFNRPVYTITATPNNASMGTVTGAGQYGYGDLCRLKATANSGHTFLDWMDIIGVAASDEAEYEFIVTGDRTLRANFFEGTDVCNLTLNLGSYDYNWGGDYLEVHFGDGMSHLFGVLNGESTSTFTLPFVNGSHVELNMQIGTFSDQYHFEVRYANGNLACTSDAVIGEYSYEFDLDCNEKPANWAYLGDGDNISDVFLPSYSYYNYGLSQQIYTADEIGSAGNITSIAFYNQGENNTKTRNYTIYLKPTNKIEFFNNKDWISVSQEDKVFSGDVTLTTNEWTFITFDKPFVYDGTSNLVLVMDDNSGNYTSDPHMECRVYGTSLDQAIRVYSDGINYDPFAPTSYSGTVMDMKNQVYFGFANIDCWPPVNLTATDISTNSATLNWEGYQDSYNVRYRVAPPFYEDFEDEESFYADWTFISMNNANDIGGDSYSAGFSRDAAHSGVYGFKFSSYHTTATGEDYNQYLISPKLTVTGDLNFYFMKYNTSTESLYVGYSTTGNDIDDFTWTEDLVPTTSWQEYTQTLPSNVKYIAFHYYGNYTFHVYLDDITIGGNGIPLGNWETVYNVTGTTTEITGLDHSTNYVWQVQGNNANCNDNGTTRWSKKATFTTECGAIIVDAENSFFEDFESEAFVPNCWDIYSTNSRQWTRSTTRAHSGSASAFSDYYGDNYLVMPDLELSDNVSAVQLSFWSYDSYPYDFAPGNNTVVLLNGNTETVLWSAETAIQDWTEATIDLSAYIGQTITLAFKYAGNNGNGWFVDEVEVAAITPIFFVNGNWNDANCWNTGSVPAEGSDVIIRADAIVPAGYAAEANMVSLEGGSITVADGGQLRHNTPDLVVTMQKNIEGYDDVNGKGNYYLLAFPFFGMVEVPAAMTANEGSDFYDFDPNFQDAEWRNNKQTAINYVYRKAGYLYASPESFELSVTGSTYALNTEYAETVTVEYDEGSSNPSNGWALLGNPFTYNAYIYRQTDDGEIEPLPIMMYDANGEIYTIYEGPVAPMQGFFVHVTETTTICFKAVPSAK